MKFKKGLKFAALGLAAAAMTPVLAACSSGGGTESTTTAKQEETTTAAADTTATTAASSSGGTKTITDNTGRTVEVPETVNSVIGLNNGLRYLCYLGCR